MKLYIILIFVEVGVFILPLKEAHGKDYCFGRVRES